MVGRKGTYGYIKRGRMVYGAVTFVLLAAVLATYFGAQWYFKTNKNVFTILAALSCIGVGKFAVDLVMFCRAGGCSESARDAIELHKGKLAGAYDLFMTSYDKNYAISHAVCAGKSVCALTEDEKRDVKSGEMHIRNTQENGGFKGYTDKIFKSVDNGTGRLDGLNRLPDSKEKKSAEGAMNLLKAISL